MTVGTEPSLNGHAPDARARVLDALGNPFSPASLAVLEAGGIDPGRAGEFGIRAVAHPDHVPPEISRYWVTGPGRGPGMLFEWRDLERTVVQFRPDTPVTDDKGDPHKYVLPKGCGTFLNHLRAPADGSPVLFVEGTKQGVSAAIWAPQGWGVVAVPGCDGWSGTDLSWADGRDVVVVFDGDLTTNRNVHDAAVKLKEALELEGADTVRFAKIAGARRTDGLDDVLGRREAGKRTAFLERLAELAVDRLGRPPARKAASAYMTDKGLLARTTALAVLEGQPAALGKGSMIALYRGGAFRVDRGREPLIDKITEMLAEDFRPAHRATVEEYLVGELTRRGLRLGDRAEQPLLNCANGMLDLRTGQLHPHDPKYLSAQQIPVPWDAQARAPHYEEWLRQVIPGQALELEEVAATMLDPSRTPAKALFAFGPSHSGKSTILRILGAVAGPENISGVSLHQLADNKFMAAALYQKMANIAADLSSAHLSDMSLFKMMSGEDVVEADRKYGLPFRFTNQALFAFSANEPPTVSETSDAYTNRISPFRFPFSFAGREDPRVELRMMAELPGILVRWVRAWQAFDARGGYLPSDPAVRQEFETRSDRVARWVATRCDVHPDAVGRTVGADQGDTVTSLYVAFRKWAEDDGTAKAMSRPKFTERLRTLPGVGEVRLRHRNKNLGLNVTTHDGEDREIGQTRVERTNHGVESVASVGTQGSSTREWLNREDDQGVGGAHSRSYVQDPPQPTLPTLPTPPVPDPFEGPGPVGTGTVSDTESDDECVRDAGPAADRVPLQPGVHRPGPLLERSPVGHAAVGGGAGQGAQALPAVQAGGGAVIPAVARMANPFTAQPPAPALPDEGDPAPGPLGFDIETAGLEWLTHGPGFYRIGGCVDSLGVCRVAKDVQQLSRWLAAADWLYGHNVFRFDLAALAREYPGLFDYDALARKTVDTYVAATVLDPPASRGSGRWGQKGYYGLDQLAQRLGVPGKTDSLEALAAKHSGFGGIPLDDPEYREYLRGDLGASAAVLRALGEPTAYLRREMRVSHLQNRMTLSGWRVDAPLLRERAAQEDARKAEAQQWLAEHCGLPLAKPVTRGRGANKATTWEPHKSPLSTDAGRDAIVAAFEAAGVTELPRTPTGKLALSADAMGEASYMIGKGASGTVLPAMLNPMQPWAADPRVRAICERIRTVTATTAKYQEILNHVVGDRVYGHVGADQASGRWAMTKPSVTNLGKRGGKVVQRAPFLPDDGHVLMAFDLDQVDMRAIAAHCQDPGYTAMFAPGQDAHALIADQVFGRHDGEWRERSKRIGHGWNYGMSVKGIALNGVPLELAQQFEDGMTRAFPLLIAWRQDVRERASRGELLDNGFGRLMRCDPGRAWTQAPALMGQGTARDLLCEGLLRLPPEYAPLLRGVVHDEVVMSVPRDRVEEVSATVQAALTFTWRGVPITCGASKPGRDWAACYAK